MGLELGSGVLNHSSSLGKGAVSILTIPELLLIAAASFAGLGAIGSLIGLLSQRPAWGLAASHLGLAGASVCAAMLAVFLFSSDHSPLPLVKLPNWAWLTIPNPRQLSLEFGFEATWIKAAFLSLIGSGILAAIWTAPLRKKLPVSENVQVISSLLFASLMAFLFSPNLPQSLLSWGVVSLLLSVLIRNVSGPVAQSASNDSITIPLSDQLELITRTLHWIGEAIVGRLGMGLTKTFPNWVGEQFEVIEESPVSTQLLAVVLGSSAVLLTWLMVS